MQPHALSSRRPGWRRLALIVVFCACVVPVRGDEFTLTDGRFLEGDIVYESETFVTIRTADGVVTVNREDIKSHRKRATPFDEYRQRLAQLDPVDTKGHFELGRWCVEKKLLQEAVFCFRKTLSIDPEHADARRELGYVRIAGRWYVDGSPEAQAAREGKTGVAAPVELPDDYVAPVVQPKSRTERPKALPSGTAAVALTLRETVDGKPPEVSVCTEELRNLLYGMREPMQLAAGAGQPALQVELSIEVKFQRTHMFYDKIPVTHVFECAFTCTVREPGREQPLLEFTRKGLPFSGSARRERPEVAMAGYVYVVRTILHQVSQLAFLQQRGAKVVEAPDW